MSETNVPTKYIRIIAEVPVQKEFRPKIGQVYPVIKEKIGRDKLYFILINGEEVGIYQNCECELVEV